MIFHHHYGSSFQELLVVEELGRPVDLTEWDTDALRRPEEGGAPPTDEFIVVPTAPDQGVIEVWADADDTVRWPQGSTIRVDLFFYNEATGERAEECFTISVRESLEPSPCEPSSTVASEQMYQVNQL